MNDELSFALIVAFVVAPIAILIFMLLVALANAWQLLSALASLPFG